MMPHSLGNIILLKEKGGWESQFVGRLIKCPGCPRRESPGIPEEKKGVCDSQGGEKDKHFFSTLLCLQFSCSIISDSLQPDGLQHARLPCPSLTHRAYSNSCPLSWRCHPTILSSVITFCSCLQSFPASGSFPISQSLASVGQNLEFQLQNQFFQSKFRTDFL